MLKKCFFFQMEISLVNKHQRLVRAASSFLGHVNVLFNYGSSLVFSSLTTVDYSFHFLLWYHAELDDTYIKLDIIHLPIFSRKHQNWVRDLWEWGGGWSAERPLKVFLILSKKRNSILIILKQNIWNSFWAKYLRTKDNILLWA